MTLDDWIWANRMNQSKVARELGLTRAYVNKLVHGRAWPSRDLATRILALTHGQVTPNDFLDQSERK